MNSELSACTGLVLAMFHSGLSAQDASMASPTAFSPPAIESLRSVSDSRVALGVHEGVLRAAGADYKAEFAAAGITVIPAFGRNAPHDYPAVWCTRAIGRGDDLLPVPTVEPVLTAGGIGFARDLCVEWYEPRVHGLEQSFVFAALPPGSGDLVVCGALATELVVAPHDGGGMRFAAEGIGSYLLTGVVGVAADGTRCAGTIRRVDGGLEYRLPAAFVATAALPLVLDPTWGAQVTVETSTAIDRHPDIARCEASSRRFLVAWEHEFSAVDYDVYGQFLDASGALSGPRLFLAATGAHERSVSLCTLHSDGFAMTYASGSGVMVRDLVGGVLGAAIPVATTGSAPDIGSHRSTGSTRVAIVWDNGLGIDYAIYAHNGTSLSLFSGPSSLLAGTASAPFNFPSISHTSGIGCDGTCSNAVAEQQSRWAIVAQRDWSTDSDLHLRVIDFNGLVVGSYAIDTSLEDHDYAEVDGNGHDWIVAWQRRVGSERDVVARPFALPVGSTSVSTPAGSPAVIAGVPGLTEVYPSVTCIGTSCMIGYIAEVAVGQFQPRMTSRSLIGCEVCAGDVPLPGSLVTSTASGRIAIASLELYDQFLTDAVIAYEYPNPAHGGNGQILAFSALFADGSLGDRVGNCGGGGGTLLTSCAISGPPAFRVHLRDSLPGAAAWLVLSPTTSAIWCGGCRLLPDPFAGVAFAATTDAIGAATVSFPSLTTGALWNMGIYAQWLVVDPASAGCPTYGVDLSAAKVIVAQ